MPHDRCFARSSHCDAHANTASKLHANPNKHSNADSYKHSIAYGDCYADEKATDPATANTQAANSTPGR